MYMKYVKISFKRAFYRQSKSVCQQPW